QAAGAAGMFFVAKERLEVFRGEQVLRGGFPLDDGVHGGSQPVGRGGGGAVDRGEERHDRVGAAAAEFLPGGGGFGIAGAFLADGFDSVGEVGHVGGGGEGREDERADQDRAEMGHRVIP